MEYEATKNNILRSQDWYQLDTKNLEQKTHQLLQKEFRGSLYLALSTVFPENDWHAWKFQYESAPRNFWQQRSNQRKYFDDLGKKIGIQSLDDWYQKLSGSLLGKNDGYGILQHFNNSPQTALTSAYPEHNWVPWKFKCTQGYWKSIDNQRKYFTWLGNEIGVKHMDDWHHKVSYEVVVRHDGRGLIHMYNNSPFAALMAVYPEHNWMPWKFETVPRSWWKDKSNQRKFLDDLGKQIQINTLDDWYSKLNSDLLEKHGGKSLLAQYNGSPAAALMSVYPEHNWIPWKFAISRGFWNSKDNIKVFLSSLSEELSIQTLDDWYRVDVLQLKLLGATSVLAKYKGLYNLLKEHYPHHPWDPKRFQSGKKTQRWLALTIKKLFPGEDIVEDYMHPKVILPSSKRPMQLDVFIPSKSLAFEYQGIQHFQEVGMFNPTKIYQQRDEEKRTLCVANNIQLIEVPYWWNRTQESLKEMIDAAT